VVRTKTPERGTDGSGRSWACWPLGLPPQLNLTAPVTWQEDYDAAGEKFWELAQATIALPPRLMDGLT
jgi:hypothetical protein